MVRFGSILILVLSAITLCAQDEPQSVLRSGLLRAQGTIAFGTFTELNSNPIYLHGNLEYYIKPGLSVRGDSYFHLPPSENSVFKMNHQLYIGPSFHLNTGGNFSPYAGIQGGFALSEYDTEILDVQIVEDDPSINPLVSAVVGFNYYATNWFHLFMDGRYVIGEHQSDLFSSSLSEFRFSFGLGFNINTK